MANEIVNKKKLRKLKIILIALVFVGFIFYCCISKKNPIQVVNDIFQTFQGESQSQIQSESELEIQEESSSEAITNVNGQMEVHFINVGQADSTLIIQNGKTMLFDVATKSRGDDIANYIKGLGIDYIDVLVLSHPHDDHMGGTAELLKNMDVGIIYSPNFFNEKLTSGWYMDMLQQIELIDSERNKGVPKNEQTSILHFPRNEQGEFVKFNVGDAVVQFLAPLEDEYSDLNDYSICSIITYGSVDIMLTGDATSSVEQALIDQNYDLDVEIFQAGHHGSDTSNSKAFLEAMSPEAIVISCGMKNKHNHPVKLVINCFKKMKIPVYRTDEAGDIVMVTDGTTYSFNKPKGTYTSGAEYRGE